jgi:hypothetical protein
LNESTTFDGPKEFSGINSNGRILPIVEEFFPKMKEK